MPIDSVNFVRTCEKGKNSDVVRFVAKDAKTGSELGAIVAENATGTIYNQPLPPGYYDSLRSTTYRKVTVPHMHISSLYVNEDARNKGIGRQLVGHIVKESKDRGYKGKVVVSAGNFLESSPLPFYKKIGFNVTEKGLASRLDFAAKYKTPFDRSIQAFMALSRDAAEKLLKSIR